jgi:hypothetical protein
VGEDSAARRSVWALMIVTLLYSAVHFAQSGVLFPLQQQNLAKFDEQTPALRVHLETGQPVHFDNAVQYGPVFFFVLHPLILWTHSTRALSNWLYALQLFCIGVGFLLTSATLKPLVRPRDWSLVVAGLAVLWLNFAPLYTILAVKSVETWELCLLSVGLFAYARGRTWVMALAIAAAALVKVLPLIFFYYLLVTNRRAFVYACVALLALLLVGHLIYGPEMGLWYWPKVVTSAAGESYGLRWHENLSLKAAIAKMFGRLEIPYAPGRSGTNVIMSAARLKAAIVVGDISVLLGLAALTLTWIRGAARSTETLLWEWSLITVAMLILSPNTTFEYATLALGALSFALVRLLTLTSPVRARALLYLGAAMFFLGVLLPRPVLNQLTFVSALSRWSGYTHLTPSEAYQYYCFPLVGLLLLVAALWRLRPESPMPSARIALS